MSMGNKEKKVVHEPYINMSHELAHKLVLAILMNNSYIIYIT